MRPRIALIIAAALVLVLFEGMADRAAAKVVRNNNAAASNPAVEEGGIRLRRGASPPPVQYSLIGALALPPPTPFTMAGALASQTRWLTRCAFWPFGFFGSLSFHHQSFHDQPFHRFGPFGLAFPRTGPFRIPARPPIDWMLPP